MTVARVLVAALILPALAACGVKNDLKLPNRQPEAPAAAPAPEAPSGAGAAAPAPPEPSR